ncbi:MAG: hypothetical protein ACLP0J_23105 [Solirubrobacteraceae bacterium]
MPTNPKDTNPGTQAGAIHGASRAGGSRRVRRHRARRTVSTCAAALGVLALSTPVALAASAAAPSHAGRRGTTAVSGPSPAAARAAERALSRSRAAYAAASDRKGRVSATVPGGPPLGVPIQTITNGPEPGYFGVQVGDQFYQNPNPLNALQLLVLNRSNLALVQNTSFTNDLAGALNLHNTVMGLSDQDLVIITKPDYGVTNLGNSDKVQTANMILLALAQIGVPTAQLRGNVMLGQSTSCEVGDGECDAFSAIGVPNLPAGQGTINPGLMALPDSGLPSSGTLNGYLQQDLGKDHYSYVDTGRIPIDTGDPNADPAQVTVGSQEPGSPFPPLTYTSDNLSGGAGFFVVVLDSGSLLPHVKQTFTDDETGLQNMAALLNTYKYDPTSLVIVRSIGQVSRPGGAGAAATAWDQVAAALNQLGGSQLYFDSLSGQAGSDQFAQVGPAGTPGYPSPWTQVATTEHGGSGRVTALLARNPNSQFYPDEALPTNLQDPSRPLAATLPGLVSLPLTQWPDQGTTGEQNALACIAATIGPGPLSTPIESNYYDTNLVADWAAWATKLDDPQYISSLSSAKLPDKQPCGPFTADDYSTVATQLSKEFTDVATVWTMIANMETPLTESQGTVADLQTITNAVNQSIGTSLAPIDEQGEAILGTALSMLAAVPPFDAVADPLNFMSGAISLSSELNTNADGANVLEQQVSTTGANLGATLQSQYTTAVAGLNYIGDILVGDWTKLQDAAENASNTTNAAADWSWDAGTFKTASDGLVVAARQQAYETLFPIAYHLYRLSDGTVPGSAAANAQYRCDYITGVNGYNKIESWQPFSAEPTQFDGDVPVVSGAGTTESWVYAVPQSTLDYSDPLRYPTQDLLNAMFVTPQSDPYQTGPLFTPLQFAVQAYNDATTNTIDVTHAHISTSGLYASSSNYGCTITPGS